MRHVWIATLLLMAGCATSSNTPDNRLAKVLATPLDCQVDETAQLPLAEGIEFRRACYGINGHAIVHIAEIDLPLDGLRFVTTPADTSLGYEVRAMTVSAFAKRYETVIAVNAGYFEPFNSGTHGEPGYPQSGNPVDILGQSISDGKIVSDNQIETPRFRLRVDGAFCVSESDISIVRGVCPSGTEQGVGSGPLLLVNGVSPDYGRFDPRFAQKRAPRTVLALNRDKSKAWFVAADGRQPGYSEGMNLPELVDLMKQIGAHDALNLDGGGSVSMAGLNGEVLSRPIHLRRPGTERPVANHIGIAPDNSTAR